MSTKQLSLYLDRLNTNEQELRRHYHRSATNKAAEYVSGAILHTHTRHLRATHFSYLAINYSCSRYTTAVRRPGNNANQRKQRMHRYFYMLIMAICVIATLISIAQAPFNYVSVLMLFVFAYILAVNIKIMFK